jgi:flagellum-specific peptidoglycan hydrolase FlgJ
MNATRQAFVDLVAPVCVQLYVEGSQILPSVRIAQTIQETGGAVNAWNNLVGYKVGQGEPNGYWNGAYVIKGTWEVYDGVRDDNVTAAFRAYATIGDCLYDHDLLLQNDRYRRVREATTYEGQCAALYQCGYATDPAYSRGLIAIIESHGLTAYDQEARDLKERIEEMEQRLVSAQLQASALQARLDDLESKTSLPVPEWAEEAASAAVEKGIIDSPVFGSYDFYRMLKVMHGAKLF